MSEILCVHNNVLRSSTVPTITWTREDGKVIDGGHWKENSKVGNSLNFTKIHRVHMGMYVCTADNGIPENARYKFDVKVHCK